MHRPGIVFELPPDRWLYCLACQRPCAVCRRPAGLVASVIKNFANRTPMTAEEALAALKTGAHTSLSEKTTWGLTRPRRTT